MNWNRSFALIKKEFWEFRRQKYILYSLLFPPLIFSFVLPFVYFVPIISQIPNVDMNAISSFQYPSTILSLDNSTIEVYIENNTANGILFITDASIDNISVASTDISECIINSSTIRDYRIENCVIRDSFITAGVVRNSLLINVTVKSSTLINCSGLNVEIWDTSYVRSENLEVVSNNGMNSLYLMRLLIDSFSLLLILLPAITPTIIASYTFVGEKNSKSLEPLLATPATDSELLWGKILAIFIPTMIATLISFVLFAVITNLLVSGYLESAPFPNYVWAVSMVVLAPLMCFLAITANVIISSKMSDVRASQQVGSLVVLPIIVLFITSLMGITSFGASPVVLVAFILVVADIIIFILAKKSFKRENILINWK